MGFIRGGLLAVVVTFLVVFLLGMNLFLVLSLSLSYENVDEGLTTLMYGMLGEANDVLELLKTNMPLMEIYCQNYSEFVVNEAGYTLEIPCGVINQGVESVLDYSVDSLVDKIYYDEYDCDFWSCFGQNELPLFLVSQKAKNYWTSNFYLALVVSIILLALVFFIVEDKTNFPILAGALFAGSALPFAKINWLFSLFGEEFESFFSIFFSASGFVFWLMLVFGAILILGGIALKIFGSEHVKKKFSEKDVKEIVSKSKKSK